MSRCLSPSHYTNTHASPGASSLCMPLGTHAGRDADARAPALSLSCAPQEPQSGRQRAHRLTCGRVQRAHEPSVRREGGEGERHITHTHTHTHTSTRASSLCRPLGTCPCVVWHAQATMLPRASSLARVLPPPLSRVPRRYLYLGDNPELTCVPLTQARTAAMSSYSGPRVTCQASCLCMPGLVVPCRASCRAHLYRLACCVRACVLRARVLSCVPRASVLTYPLSTKLFL